MGPFHHFQELVVPLQFPTYHAQLPLGDVPRQASYHSPRAAMANLAALGRAPAAEVAYPAERSR